MLVLRLVALVAALLALGTGTAFGQIVPLPLSSGSPATSHGIRQEGLFSTAPIELDGATLFRIAASATPAPGQLALVDRMTTIDAALQESTSTVTVDGKTLTAYSPSTFRVEIRSQRGQALLEASDAKHDSALPLLTVTSVDAQYNGTDVPTLAKQWQQILQDALVAALQKRQPATERRHVMLVIEVGGALALATPIALSALAALGLRKRRIEEEIASRAEPLAREQARGPDVPASEHERRRRLLVLSARRMAPERRLQLVSSVSAVLLWSVLLVWFAAVTWGLSLFPQTSPFATTISHDAIGVVAIWIVTGLLNRVADIAIARIANALCIREDATSDDTTRKVLRVPTVAHALSGFKAFVLVFLAILATLGQIGLPIGSVVTIGGLVAIAVSFAAQNFVRDFVNGFLVLAEDHYVVGDFVTINGLTGLVELLTLRVVQIRDVGGSLVTIPHSSVTNVVNHSRNWSRVDYRLSIDPGADAAKAVALLRGVIDEVANDPAWREAILTPLEWIGVEAVTRDFTLLRASVKTAPLRQFELRREINERAHRAFREAGIGFGAPIPPDQIPLA
jgi:small conductance mechanosensitive channel